MADSDFHTGISHSIVFLPLLSSVSVNGFALQRLCEDTVLLFVIDKQIVFLKPIDEFNGLIVRHAEHVHDMSHIEEQYRILEMGFDYQRTCQALEALFV